MSNSNENQPAEEQNLPNWLKQLRFLVFALIIASILAMCTLIWAAFKIVTKETASMPLDARLSVVSIPDDASLISITTLENGELITIYHDGSYQLIHSRADGSLIDETEFQ